LSIVQIHDAFGQAIPEVQAKQDSRTKPVTFETRDSLSNRLEDQPAQTMPFPAVKNNAAKKKIENGDELIHFNLKTRKEEKENVNELPVNVPSAQSKSGFRGIIKSSQFDRPPELKKLKTGKNEDLPDEIQKFSSLQQVSNPEQFPYRMNVKIWIKYPNDSVFVCSGSLVDYEWIVTAGHCVYKSSKGGWVKKLVAIPGYDNGNKPFGRATGTDIHSLTSWTHGEDHDYDIAWVKLDRPVGFLTGWFNFGYENDDSYFKNSNFYNPGYPAEAPYDGKYMYKWGGSFDFKFFQSEKYSMGQDRVGYGGQSGSGVYGFKNGNRIVYGVASHTLLDDNDNRLPPTSYTRITEHRFHMIDDQINNDRPSTLDLVALNAKASSERPVEGMKPSSFGFDVVNRSSSEPSGTWHFDVYLSDDADITTDDTFLGSQSFSHDFSQNSKIHVNAIPPKIPVGNRGHKYLGVILDQNDLHTGNNDTDGWDAAAINIIPSRVVQVKINRNENVKIWVSPLDINDEGNGMTDFSRRYADATHIELTAPKYVGPGNFLRWVDPIDGSYATLSEEMTLETNVGHQDHDYVALYKDPDIPVMPHIMGETLPEHETRTKTHNLQIVNSHNVTIDWNISVLHYSRWLSTNKISGSTDPDQTTNIDVIFDASNMDKGSYTDTLKIYSNVDGVAPTYIPVNLWVGAVPGTVPTPEEAYKMMNPIPDALFGMGLAVDPVAKLISFGSPGLNEQSGGTVVRPVLDDGTLGEETMITPERSIAGSYFGTSQAMLDQGKDAMLVAGAPGSPVGDGKFKASLQSAYTGRVYMFQKTSSGWSQTNMINPDIALEDARFGYSVDVTSVVDTTGEYMVAIGAPALDYENLVDVGAVFVYHYVNGDIAGRQVIYPNTKKEYGYFGHDVDLVSYKGMMFLVAGGPGLPAKEIAGAAEIYRFNGMSWQLTQTIDGQKMGTSAGFGSSVAMTWNDTQSFVMVGAPGYGKFGGIFSYKFTPTAEGWTPFGSIVEGPKSDKAELGKSLQLYRMSRHTILLAGAPGVSNSTYGGESFVYQLNDGDKTWRLRSQLTPKTKSGSEQFGNSIAALPIKNQMLYLSSAPGSETGGQANAGQVYQYKLKDPATLPKMDLSKTSFSQEIVEGKSKSLPLTIQNTGEAELRWSIPRLPSWLSADTTSGSIGVGSSQNIQLSVDGSRMQSGQYDSNFILTSNDLSKDTTNIQFSIAIDELVQSDLFVSDLMITAGDSIEAGGLIGSGSNVFTANNGPDLVDTTFSVGLYISPDSLINETDTLIAAVNIDTTLGIEQGMVVPFPTGTRIPGNFPAGKAYIGVKVDYTGNITEMNTEDNVILIPVTIKEASRAILAMDADYQQVKVELPSSGTKGTPIQLRNDGAEDLKFSIPGFGSAQAATTGPKSVNTTTAAADSIPAYLMDISPSAGTITPGDTAKIVLTMDGQSLDAGTYKDTLNIVTNDPDHSTVSIPMEVTVVTGTDIEKDQQIPDSYSLDANYPNPFNPTTNITFGLPESSQVRLEIYNLLGQRVAVLVNERRSAGRYTVQFDASRYSSGVYIYHLKAGSFSQTRKMLLMK